MKVSCWLEPVKTRICITLKCISIILLLRHFVLITLCCKTKYLRGHHARLWTNRRTGLHNNFWMNIGNSCNCAVEAACLVVLKRSIVFTTFHYYAFIRWFGRPSSLWINSSFKLKKMPQWAQKLFEISTFNCCLCIHC